MSKKKERELPAIGSTFSKKWKGTIYTLTVVEEDGIIKYSCQGKVFNSPSGAALSVIKNQYQTNGWAFWGMDKY